MAAYTWLFVRSYKVFPKQMMDFYEEEELLYRMRWIKWIFWSALAVGILALLLIIDNHMVNVLLTLLFTAYFLFVTVSFINYQQYAQLIVRAYESEPHVSQQSVEKEKMSQAEVEKIRAGISEWVREKKYVESDHSVEEIARQLGTNSTTLRKYFHNYVGEDFRTWRIGMRIEEAKRLIDENPSIKINDVVNLTGFNDRPYFYRIFTKMTGMSVTEYRNGEGHTIKKKG
jgi:YesN/AraC family two-component response regulator